MAVLLVSDGIPSKAGGVLGESPRRFFRPGARLAGRGPAVSSCLIGTVLDYL
ncbi:MAG: hypothetical protein LBQ12_13030 [Deltaproteobacteria bacterium]|nr:hypothetical protein [Deltaproteobacteria bacterium]